MNKQTDELTDGQPYKHINKQTDRQFGRQMNRQKNRQTDRCVDKTECRYAGSRYAEYLGSVVDGEGKQR